MPSKTPVVVVDGSLNSLGVVRSLARGGMPIYLASTTRICAAGWSRHCTFVRVPSLEGHALIDSLKALAARLGQRPVLILTSDQCVDAVSTYRDEIEPLYRISLPSADMVRTLADKTLFQALAEREKWAVPRGMAMDASTDRQELQRLTPPLIIKPADKKQVISGAVERAVRANTLAEAQAAVDRMVKRATRVIVQEWIDGPDSEIYFSLFLCDRQSRLIGFFSGRKLVCSPPAIGSTAVCVAAPDASQELRVKVLDFITRVGYCGLGSLEFKRDIRTGQFTIIEPTAGRTDWQEEIATLCGINLPLMAYEAELGLSPHPAGETRSMGWRESFEHAAPPGVLPPGTHMIEGYFRWSDPLPALYFYLWERFTLRVAARAASLFLCVMQALDGMSDG